MSRKGAMTMTSRSDRHSQKIDISISVTVLLALALSQTSPVHAAEIHAVSEVSTFGAIDGEFGLCDLKGLYRWNVIKNWSAGTNATRSDNTFGVVGGEFTAPAMYVANSRTSEIGFNDRASFKGTTDENGAVSYLPDQNASFSQQMMGNPIKYVLMNNAYHVVGTGERYEIEVVTRNGYLTCADGTEVNFIGIYAEEISNDRYSPDSGFQSLPLYEPGTYTPAGLSGQYNEGRIVLRSNQKAIIRSTRELRLVDGTILLPGEDGIYDIEIRDGLPTFVNVTVKEGSD
jgi:hypothetical protein